MEISNDQIEQIFKLSGAAIGGGAVWKIVDLLVGRRKRKVDSDAVSMDSAIKLVQSLNTDIERLKEENIRFNTEKNLCIEKYESMRVELTDIKIVLRNFFDYVQEHMRKCKEPMNLPSIPESLKK